MQKLFLFLLANINKGPLINLIKKMFLESPTDHPMQKGSIEVICGSMFSGKTEELLRRLKRAKYAKLNIKIFKPKVDTRYDKEKVVSHDDNYIKSIVVENKAIHTGNKTIFDIKNIIFKELKFHLCINFL